MTSPTAAVVEWAGRWLGFIPFDRIVYDRSDSA